VDRKVGKSRRSAKPTARDQSDQTMLPLQPRDRTTVARLRMEIQVGDRFTAEGLELEVVSHPGAPHGGKTLRARVQRPGLPESEQEITWPAHVRVEIRRGPTP
jgi:hypothetical protein